MKTLKIMLMLGIALAMIQCSSTDDPLPQIDAESIDCSESNACDLAKANNAFGFDLFQKLHEQLPNDNVFISPNSVATALAMTLNGAAGETEEDMQQTLKLQDWTLADMNAAYRYTLPLLPNLDNNVDMAIANAIYHDQNYPVYPAFLELNQTNFYSPAEALNFRDPASVDIINGWVNDNTNGLIPDIIETIPPEAVMYLLNAIYFKAPWRYQFDPALTSDRPFYLEDGTTAQVPMMTFGEEVSVSTQWNELYQAIDLPYADSVYSMTLFLPNPDVSMDELVNELSTADWNQISTSFYKNT
jgi:serine protease inhibitor